MGVTSPPLIRLENISMVFPAVKALQNVSFEIRQGECMALVGENGAGKSTLSKIVVGEYTPTEGKLFIDGQDVTSKGKYSIKVAQEMGITICHQELQLIPELNGYENICLGKFDKKLGFISKKGMQERCHEILKFLDVEIDLSIPVKKLRVAERQIIQLAKAVSDNARLIILDELTAVLQEKEIKNIYRIIDVLKKRGVAIIYISHRLDEIFEVCDSYTVLTDGVMMHTGFVKDVNKDQLIEMIIGRQLTKVFPKLSDNIGDPVLTLKNWQAGDTLKNINFELREGEIVGIAGLVGAGKTELLNSIFGNFKTTGGEMILKGKQAKIKSPIDAIKNGIGLVPDERKALGLVLGFSVQRNTTLATLKNFKKLFLNQKKEREVALDLANKLHLNYAGLDQAVSQLSGGNQQKIVISKWLLANSDILMFDEPTRGIDIGAKSEIYNLINNLSSSGKSIIIVSPELEELLGLCHRIYVMFNGEIKKEVNGINKSQEGIIHEMLGVTS